MMKTFFSTLASALVLLSLNSNATDISNGQALHTEHCMACHTTDKYTSSLRKVNDLKSLTNRVRRCDFSLGTQFFDDDIEDIVTYLNQTYYQFEPKQAASPKR